MKLLIVEDNLTLARLTAELLRSVDKDLQPFEAIALASDLQTAIGCPAEVDAVLCGGNFPLSPDSRFISEQWEVVLREMRRRGIHFVLYSGSDQTVDCARRRSALAVSKPAAIEDIYAALTNFSLPLAVRAYPIPAGRTEN